jgi:hypothetical protein
LFAVFTALSSSVILVVAANTEHIINSYHSNISLTLQVPISGVPTYLPKTVKYIIDELI